MTLATLEHFLFSYGYFFVLIGTFLEGETTLVIAGIAANAGYLHLPLVMLVAAIGATSGHQFYFYLGRRHGQSMLARHRDWNRRIARVNRFLERNQTLAVLSFRFLYGLRSVAAFAIGLSAIPAWKFIALELIATSVWAVTIGSLGYLLGYAATNYIDVVKHYQLVITVVLLATASAIVGYRVWQRARAKTSN